MKLSEFSMSVLKNFSTINSGMVLRQGNLQKTMSADKCILAEVEIDDIIPTDFGIYELSQFLGNVTTLNNPDMSFNDNCVLMTDGNLQLKYYSCSPNLIITPPDKKLVMEKVDVSFSLTKNIIQKLLQLSAMNNFPNLSIVGRDGKLEVVGHDRSNDTSNSVKTQIGEWDGDSFIASFKTDNLKMILDDYDVELKVNAFAKFTSKNRNLKYFIALEAN